MEKYKNAKKIVGRQTESAAPREYSTNVLKKQNAFYIYNYTKKYTC